MISVNDRVRNYRYPELGYGTVKAIDSDPLDETEVIHVAFDWSRGITTCECGVLEKVCSFEHERRIQESDLGSLDELRCLLGCGMILSENARTACFSRALIIPLPHQAYLLEKVYTQNRMGHLVADDVGMGKTIEAGLIISAARQSNDSLRVLVLAPKNVVLQWQDEMDEHFGLDFRIAKRDFEIKNPKQWGGINLVIAGRDGMKQDRYRDVLKAIPPFDLIVVDEAHALTARRDFLSGDIERTENYRFVKWLSDNHIVKWANDAQGAPRSPNFIFLTATPHQGDDTRFAYLLGLVRPDLVEPENRVWLDGCPETLKQCVSRTAKKCAVDWNGNPIFRGHQSKTVDISLTDREEQCLTILSWYVRDRMVFNVSGRAEALVRALAMHTYQKIAASSWIALKASLQGRLEGRKVEDFEDDFDSVGGEQEQVALKRVLAQLEALDHDSKLEHFLGVLRPGAGFRLEGEKVLIFTQYRVTQQFLKQKLEAEGFSIGIINGSLSVDERRDQRAFFEDSADCMISTEAGSEGANLQRKCHLVINYDSPWNPMRLLQRVGRLDRYGQKNVVKALTLRALQSWDAQIALKIESKLESIQDVMGLVAEEDYRDMIIGEVYESIDVSRVMADAGWNVQSPRIDKVIAKEIERIREDASRLKRMLSESVGMPEGYEKRQSSINAAEFRMAFKWAAAAHEVKLRETRTQENKYLPGVYHFRLPEAFRGLLRASKECYLVFEREKFLEVKGEVIGRARGQEIRPVLAGMGDPVTDWFFRGAISAKSPATCFSLKSQGADRRTAGMFWVVFLASWSQPEKGPDRIDVCEVDAEGCFVRRPSPGEVFARLQTSVPVAVSEGLRIPSLTAATTKAREELKAIVAQSPDIDRNQLRFSPWLLVSWS